jgi:hypothetical protein
MNRLSTPGVRLLTASGIVDPRSDDGGNPPGSRPGTAPQRIVVYQRDGGDDRTADGTLARPFKTLQAALATWPLDAQGNTYVIDRTGCTDQLPPAFSLPALRDSRGPQLRFPAQPLYPPFSSEGAFNILAEPRTLATVEEIGETATHPRSQIVTVTVPGATWIPDQFRGRQIVAADGFGFAIHSNTADTLRLCSDWAPRLPWRIVEPSAVLIGDSDPAQARGAINLNGAQATIVLGGQRIHSSSASAGALHASGCLRVMLYACEIEGDLQLSESASPIYFGACSLRPGVGYGAFLLERGSALLFNSLVEGFRVQAVTAGVSDLVMYQSVVEKNLAPLGLDLARLQLYRSEVLNSTGSIIPGGIAAGAIGTGQEQFGLSGGEISLNEVRVDGCSGDGISIGIRSAAALRNVGGTNAGLGLRVWSGGQVMVDAKSDVTGAAGDMKVGARAARAWSDFRAQALGGNEADFLDPEKSDGSRLFQAS